MKETLFWSAATFVFYLVSKAVHARCRILITTPLLLTPILLLAALALLHADYADYNKGTHWILMLLGPATVAFAVPIYEQRHLAKSYWRILLLGVIVGSIVSFTVSWLISDLFRLSTTLRTSLLPRSVTTPFAMTVSGDIGGDPQLTAIFVIITGLFGATIGERLMRTLGIRTPVARGALLGMAAHSAGVAKARELGEKENAIAGLVMLIAGLLNVAVGLAVSLFLHH